MFRIARQVLAGVQSSGTDGHMQVEATILAGPRLNLAAFLKALARLEASTAFLAQHR